MESNEIIQLGGFKKGDTYEEAMGKMMNLVVRIENNKLNRAIENDDTTDRTGDSDARMP